MSGALCRVCGTEQPEQAAASPVVDDGSDARIAEMTQTALEGAEKLAALSAAFEALKAHAAELEAMLTAPAAEPQAVEPAKDAPKGKKA